ncbi:MAG: isocitrate lyase, partial [Rhodospirillales bacterium]|nr:isocitrate lyase [Rhodospirillales bacterium]
TQSLGCWHGFIGQQKLISIKKHFGTTDRRYLYLSGWMIAALRSEFGPLPDQSMHEKTSVPALIEELYTFLRQADSRELNQLFRDIDAAREAGDKAKEEKLLDAVDNYQTHIVPIIADIDAGFGNAEATYLLAKKMIEAGACALQIENQVSDEKQCGHQDGKVTVPHEDFLAKVRACRYAFLELGVENGIDAEAAARMRLQNRFKTGLEIARYTADIMRRDMAAYDADPANYTQSLGCWHGFIGQQKLISIKKHFGTTDRKYLYLSGWMIAALRSEFGPLPDQSMHEKTSVPALIEELYTFLRQADSRELNQLFRDIDAAREAGDTAKEERLLDAVDNFQTHIVPIIADIDAGFGNAEATYLLAKKMIEAGACALQIENQVSDEKQCGHQDGKVTVPHEDFLAKIRACRYAFMELGIDDGIIVARTDSLGAGLTKQIAFTREPGDLGDQYNAFLDCEAVEGAGRPGDVLINRDGVLMRPKRLPSNLYQFRPGTGEDRCVLDCITALQNGADLLWIETEKPHIAQIAGMVDRIRAVIPDAKLVYNNSPSFNWTLNFRCQVFDAWTAEGRDLAVADFGDFLAVEECVVPVADVAGLAGEGDLLGEARAEAVCARDD